MYNPINEDAYLGAKIREARERSHMTQKELAAKLRIHSDFLDQIEKGEYRPPMHLLVEIGKETDTEMVVLSPALCKTKGTAMAAALGCKTCPISDCDAQYRGSRCAALRGKYNLGDPTTMAEKFQAMDDKALASLFAGFCSVADCTTNKRGGTLRCPLYGRCPGRPALSDWEAYMLSPASKKTEDAEDAADK